MPMVTEMHRLQKFSCTGKLTDSHVGNRIRRDYKYLPIKGESMHVCGPGATCSHLELSFLTWSSSPWMFKLFVIHTTVFTEFMPRVQHYSKCCWGLWQNAFAKNGHITPCIPCDQLNRNSTVETTLLRLDREQATHLSSVS